MVRAEHRTLHEAETALCGVGMHEAAKLGEFVRRVINGAVIRKLPSYFFIYASSSVINATCG